MFNIGPGELVAILAVALIVLGPNRLPEAVRTVGRVVGELRRISSGFQDELRNAFDDGDVIDQLETKPVDPSKPTSQAIDTAAVGLSGATVSTEPLDGDEDVVDGDRDDDDLDRVDDLDDEAGDTLGVDGTVGVDDVDDVDDVAGVAGIAGIDEPPESDQRAAS
jgi:sec-independent protein translocase protein TatB